MSGNFYCNGNDLTSLSGCPVSVGGNFSCSFNRLTSLEGCPNNVILEEKNLYNGKGEKIGVYYVNEKLNYIIRVKI